ncbi:MAG: DUF494 family protein [Legionellaceae bacterium]|nr:DUF494 family protein [Legionellaceae bacterium]
MKDGLFEMLLSLFEKTLTQLKEKHQSDSSATQGTTMLESLTSDKKVGVEVQIVKPASEQGMRVFTRDEQLKFTKASYQFLMRMASLGLIDQQTMELVINRLFFSDSRFVSLQETKWTIRNTLAQSLDAEQLAFLELVLYFKEDGLSLH